MESEETTLPRGFPSSLKYKIKATLNAFVKEVISKKVKCSNDFIDIVNQISTLYIKHISSEANRICLTEGKKTITPEFIFKALKSLNFEDHLEVAKQAQMQCDQEVQKRNKMKQEFQQNFNQEELLKEQQKFFDESAHEFQKQQQLLKISQFEEGKENNDNNDQVIAQDNKLFESQSIDEEDYEN